MGIKQKIIAVAMAIACMAYILPAMSAYADDGLRFQGISTSGSSLTAIVEGGSATSVGYMVYDNYTLVCEGSIPYSSGNAILPVQASFLRAGRYKVSVWGDGGTSNGRVYTFDANIGSWNGALLPQSWATSSPSQAERSYMVAIKTPQATVYGDAAMTAEKYTLKKHDRLFYMPTNNPLIHYVFGYLVSGDSIQTENEGEYKRVSNTFFYDGYIWANSIQSVLFDEDIKKELVELAYTRLGLNGIYSMNTGNAQTGRWGLHTQDCSSYMWWLYKEYGLMMSGTTAGPEAVWCQDEGVAIYDQTETIKPLVKSGDGGNLADYISADMADLYYTTYYYQSPNDSLTDATTKLQDYRNTTKGPYRAVVDGFEAPDGNVIRSEPLNYSVVSNLQPSDTLYFNHYEDVVFEIICREFTLVGWVYYHFVFGRQAQIEEVGSKYGIDHTAMYIDNSKYIHASGRAVNTVISDLTYANIKSVIAIGRPIDAMP